MRENQVLGILIIKFMKRVMGKFEKLCIKWLNDNYNPMEPFYMEKYPDYIFHMKNGQCILQYNKKCGYVYVSYREIWSFFEGVFSMSNQQIKDITKIWVEEHYKMEVEIRKCVFTDGEQLAEEEYRKITTTKGEVFWLDKKVEEQYQKITTTVRGNGDILYIAEEQYQKIKTTGLIHSLESLTEEEYQKTDITIANGLYSLLIPVEEEYQNIQTTNNQNG